MSAVRSDHVRAFDAIAIKEVLTRVGISRRAAAARARERLVEFAPAILEQVARERAERGVAVGDERAAARERLCNLLADLVLANLRALPRRASPATTSMPPELLARYLASSFVLVLDWWEESPVPVPVREADEYFRSLVLPTLETELR